MDPDWTVKVAAQTAKDKCEEAAVLLRTAHDIFSSIGQDVNKMNVVEALTYIEEVTS